MYVAKKNWWSLRWVAWLVLMAGIPLVGVTSASRNSTDAAKTIVDDPIFGLYYDPNDIHFDELETRDLLPMCRRALSDFARLPLTLTLYAQYVHESTKIYVAGRDDNDKILVIRNGTCDAGVPIMAILQRHHEPRVASDGPMLSDSEVSALFDDALARYGRAFGGKDRFLAWLDSIASPDVVYES